MGERQENPEQVSNALEHQLQFTHPLAKGRLTPIRGPGPWRDGAGVWPR